MKKLSINQFLTSKVTALDQNQMRHILGGNYATNYTDAKSGASGYDSINPETCKTEFFKLNTSIGFGDDPNGCKHP